MEKEQLKEKVLSLPMSPGVYIFSDISGEVIYIGKAKQLKSRVGSYFQSGVLPGTKTYALVSRISDLNYILVENELEALILESELIKKHRPKYNIVQKDDKSYLYIVFRKSTLPTSVLTARETDLLPKDLVFGPYPNGATAREILAKLRKVFPFRDCSDNKYKLHKKRNKQCLYGDLGLCTAPCVASSAEDITKYNDSILRIKKVLQGKSNQLIKTIDRQMKKSAANQEYEKAAEYRDTLEKYHYMAAKIRGVKEYIENPYLIDDIAEQSLDDLMRLLPWMPRKPGRIECYDISNLSGTEAVGSLVVALNGKINKREYKRFKIKRKNTPDDFAMMNEVLARRLAHSYGEKGVIRWPEPDLLILDGGKGQLSAVRGLVNSLDSGISIIGIEKKFETIVFFNGHGYTEARFPKDSPGMKLVISLRDEAHRFAQAYHHKLRSKTLLKKGYNWKDEALA